LRHLPSRAALREHAPRMLRVNLGGDAAGIGSSSFMLPGNSA
jgi:hypothetical protein